MKLKISVALCTYNGGKYVERQLKSIIGQSRIPDEIIISDDSSEDDTREILGSIAPTAPLPIHLNVNPARLGSTKNFEKATLHCSGDIIVFSDQDDWWHPQKLERIEKIFIEDDSVGAVFSNAEMIDANGSPLGYTLWESVKFSKYEQAKFLGNHAIEVLVRHNVVNGASLAIRSSLRPLLIPFPDSGIHDEWIALLISAVSHFSFVSDPLIQYRQHGQQQLGGEKKGFLRHFSESNQYSSDYFSRRSEFFAQVRDRLQSSSCYLLFPGVIGVLNGKIIHLKNRASIIRREEGWILLWLNNVFSARYHRYSSGFISAARDILLP